MQDARYERAALNDSRTYPGLVLRFESGDLALVVARSVGIEPQRIGRSWPQVGPQRPNRHRERSEDEKIATRNPRRITTLTLVF